ncbi:MAG TPA: glycosyltransferase family 39 protein, partial [Dehalococcoidia bacterium]|nr:glycosyltransferase family 39 protein [Dehalococcoidia bacterium]
MPTESRPRIAPLLVSLRQRARASWDEPAVRTWRQGITDSLLAFGFTRLVMIAVFVSAAAIVPAKNSLQIPMTWPDFDGILSQGDGGWYLDLAAHGYDPGSFSVDRQANWTYFPLYPLSIRLFTELGVGNGALVGILLSNLFSLAALVVLWKLTQELAGGRAARRAVFYLCAFPTSIFLSAVSNMGLALLLLTTSMYFLLRGRWAPSSLSGAVAVLARGQAIFAVAPLAWSALTNGGDWRGRLRRAPCLLPAPFALAAFMMFMLWHTGNALAFWEIQEAWGRELTFPGRVIGSFLLHPRLVGQGESAWDFTAMNVSVAVAAVVGLPFVFRAFGG